MSKLNIYRASAGSGKTYALTFNYLRLALQQPDKFKSILAVTFTNKATDEMKSRIISTLQELKKGSHPMAFDLLNELKISPEKLQSRAEKLLTKILHNYSFFAVSTIDTFFQRVVRSFTREIGIHSGYRIELDQRKVLGEVIDDMLASLAEDKSLIRWLTDYANFQINQGKSWDSRREIKQLSYELFKENVVLNKERIFAPMESEETMASFVQSIFDQKTSFESQYTELGKAVQTILESHGIKPLDLTHGSSGVGGYILAVSKGEFKEPGKRVFDAIYEEKWLKKGSEFEGALHSALDEGLNDALEKTANYCVNNLRDYNSISQVSNFLYAFGLLSKVHEGLEKYREENEMLLIGDFPVFLKEIISDSDSPYIYEKVGSRFDHFLIDEFQDTSGLQWLNFKPLIEDSLSAGNENLIVGDIKQSIYRWRGGNWKILLEQVSHDISKEYISEHFLDTNRRSKKVIVEFNNQFFGEATEILDAHLQSREKGIEDHLKINAAYKDVYQHAKDDEQEGLVQIDFLEKEELEDVDDAVVNQCISQIKNLQDNNYQPADITILVRTNDQGRKVAKVLMDQSDDLKYDFTCMSNESLFVKNNPAVHFILQVLDMLSSPKDEFKLKQATIAFDHYMGREDPEVSDYLMGLMDERFLTLSDAVGRVERRFDLLNSDENLPFILAFRDAVHDFMKYNQDSIRDFMKWWIDNDSRSIQISGDQNAIQIMTIHQSKGLQFKAVLIPWANWKLDQVGGFNLQLLWCEAGKLKGVSGAEQLPVRYSNGMRNSVFDQVFFEEKNDIHLDNLNLLYVAMTRAEEVLMMTCPLRSEKSGDLKDVADLMFEFSKEKNESQMTYQVGSMLAYSQYELEQENTLNLTSRKINKVAQPNTRNFGFIASEERQRSIDFGEVVHWIFSEIKSKDDFQNVMNRAHVKFSLDDKDMNRVKLLLRETWEIPGVSDWFSPQWAVKNEQNILLSNGKMKRPDRVISNENQTIVIDFKTGKKSEKHINQVREYKELLSQMGHSNVHGYLLYFSPIEVIQA